MRIEEALSELDRMYHDFMSNWRLEIAEDGSYKYYIEDYLIKVELPESESCAPNYLEKRNNQERNNRRRRLYDENISLIDCLLDKDGDVE